jgi:hypothetical protein
MNASQPWGLVQIYASHDAKMPEGASVLDCVMHAHGDARKLLLDQTPTLQSQLPVTVLPVAKIFTAIRRLDFTDVFQVCFHIFHRKQKTTTVLTQDTNTRTHACCAMVICWHERFACVERAFLDSCCICSRLKNNLQHTCNAFSTLKVAWRCLNTRQRHTQMQHK